MRDQDFDRDYQASRAEFNHGLSRLIEATAYSFRRLAAIQFEAPWQRSSAKYD